MKKYENKFYISSKDISNAFCDLVVKADEIYLSVAWTTDGHEAYKVLIENKHKIKRFFCGIERNLTSPEVMRNFLGEDSFRIVDDNELFHHKVYIFKYKGSKGITTWETMVGSSNFTNAGFNKNFEVVQHTRFDSLINLHEELEQSFFSKSIVPDQIYLDKYIFNYNESKKKNNNDEKQRNYQKSNFYRLTWNEYFSEIQKDQFHSLKGRLKLLGRNKKLLNQVRFDKLSVEDRKKIAGTYFGEDNEIEDFDTRWFGGMSGAGYFSQNVIDSPGPIAEAIEMIPKEGIVTEENYNNFMKKMIPASGYDEGEPLAVSTRVLAMIRPDYFFCATSANKTRLSQDLKFSRTTLKIDNYWERVVEPLINSKWWEKKEFSSDFEKSVWEARIALLDILYYIPKE